jgi:hypothetical protein
MYLALIVAYVAVLGYMAQKPAHVLETRSDLPAALVGGSKA